MLFNWFTVVAQIINFLILIWLLKRYLYKPILKAIEEREQRIAAQLKKAEKKEADAAKEKELFHAKNEDLERNRIALMNKASEDAQAERVRVLEQARKDALALHQKLENSLREEQASLNSNISRRIAEEVFAAARKILKELADQQLEDQIIHTFIRRLRESVDAKTFPWSSALNKTQQEVTVKSGFPLSTAQRSHLEKSILSLLDFPASFKYVESPELIAGIEFSFKGYKMTWTVNEHLSSIEKAITQLVKGKVETIKDEVSQ